VIPLLELSPQQLAQLQAQLDITFLIVCLIAIAVIWGMMQWFYKERIKKIKHLFTMANEEVGFETRKRARIENELKREFDDVKKDLVEKEAAAPLAKTINEALDASHERSPEIVPSLTQKISSMEAKLAELSRANAAVSNAVSHRPWLTDSGSGLEGARSGFGAGEFPSR
jgi:hypothetical protein